MYEPTQRLLRSRSEHMLGGVAGGIARYLAIDPVFVRLVFIAGAFTGIGVILYPILWAIMPQEPEDASNQVYVAHGSASRRPRFDLMTGEPVGGEDEIPINNVTPPSGSAATNPQRNRMLAYALLVVGVLFLLTHLLPIGALIGKLLFPALLIVAGLWLLGKNQS
ncbi:MAG: PspC domain-containing protein [Roseiflexaceae bacterium]|nr:PspC domain-containing protein [Roseiflexaceae bacterium]